MKLVNSLSATLEEFKPIDTGKVRMYSCGPTVYNNLHIGNLSAFIYADTLRRTLEVSGFDVQHVMNITDVDDKTIRDSKREYPDDDPKIALKKLTDRYTDVFMKDLESTGNDVSHITFISAVETIPEMIELTQRIIDAGIGYLTDDGVYFSIQAYKQTGHPYGLLQKVSLSEAKSRVANDEYDKESASDFALWKATTDGEPAWDASFTFEGKTFEMAGRPGWHIECSAMSEKLLKVPFDIHTGGIDLKFPHHENEIAQTCASGASSLSTYFVHNNHILVDGRKMSKSLGNFYTLRDIEDKGYTADAFRLLVLESHYSSESNFTFEILDAATNRLKKWRATADRLHQQIVVQENTEQKDIDDILKQIILSMQDDLDTPNALTLVDGFMDTLLIQSMDDSNRAGYKKSLRTIETILGITLLIEDPLSEDVLQLLESRVKAREAKEWDKSDMLRKELEAHSIGVQDTSSGQQIWYRL